MQPQRIIITGGGSGLGRATARCFADRGSQVLVADLDPGAAQATADLIVSSGGTALACGCDVRREESLQALADIAQRHWDGFDVWINNAGVAHAGDVADTALAHWQWIVDINLLGCVRGARVAIPVLQRQGSGHIVNVASFAGIANPPGMAAYNATKAAVISLSETLRLELGHRGIGVSVACPSFFKTRLLDTSEALAPNGGEPADTPMREVTQKLMERAEVTAEDVAQDIFDAVRRKRFMVMTHADARTRWRIKRFFPELYFRMARRLTAKFRESRRP